MLNKGFFHSPTNPKSTTGYQLIIWFIILVNKNVPSCENDNYFRITEYLEKQY